MPGILSVLKGEEMPESNEHFDLTATSSILNLDESVVNMLVGNFISAIDNDLDELEVAIKSGNFQKISAKAHYIKGAAENLRLKMLVPMLKDINHASIEEQEVDYLDLLARARQEVECIKGIIS